MYENNKPGADIVNASPDWMTSAHRKTLLCFVHVPKAAGTALNNVLYHVYGRTFVSYHNRLSPFETHQLNRTWAKEVFALGGHNPFGFHRQFGPWYQRYTARNGVFSGRDVRYISMVRNPIERMHSYYRFVKTFAAHRLHRETRHMGCEEFFSHMEAIENMECIANLQCALISGGSDQADDAVRRVKNDYMLVGTADKSSDFISKLSESLEWPEVNLERKNVSPVGAEADEDREIIAAFVNKFNYGDNELYEFVRSYQSALPNAA